MEIDISRGEFEYLRLLLSNKLTEMKKVSQVMTLALDDSLELFPEISHRIISKEEEYINVYDSMVSELEKIQRSLNLTAARLDKLASP